MIDPKTQAAIDDGKKELGKSLESIFLKHGAEKAGNAVLLHNAGTIVSMLRRHEIEPWIVGLVERQFIAMWQLLCLEAELDPDEIATIAKGITEQCMILTEEVKEVEKANQAESGT